MRLNSDYQPCLVFKFEQQKRVGNMLNVNMMLNLASTIKVLKNGK